MKFNENISINFVSVNCCASSSAVVVDREEKIVHRLKRRREYCKTTSSLCALNCILVFNMSRYLGLGWAVWPHLSKLKVFDHFGGLLSIK